MGYQNKTWYDGRQACSDLTLHAMMKSPQLGLYLYFYKTCNNQTCDNFELVSTDIYQ